MIHFILRLADIQSNRITTVRHCIICRKWKANEFLLTLNLCCGYKVFLLLVESIISNCNLSGCFMILQQFFSFLCCLIYKLNWLMHGACWLDQSVSYFKTNWNCDHRTVSVLVEFYFPNARFFSDSRLIQRRAEHAFSFLSHKYCL